jgi:hypothetical protein
MDKQLKIQLLENRAAILESNGRDNKKVVAKIRRQIRNLQNSEKSE